MFPNPPKMTGTQSGLPTVQGQRIPKKAQPEDDVTSQVRAAAAATPTPDEHRAIRKQLRAKGHPNVRSQDGPLTDQEVAGVRQHMLAGQGGNALTAEELTQVRKALADG